MAASRSRTIGPVQDPEGRNRPRRIWRVSWATRILAPLALIVVLGAVYLVVTSAGDDGNTAPAKTKVATDGKGGKKGGKGDQKKAPKTYTIKSGDSLSTIAAKFGVTVDDLERWNTDANIDPQALVAGQELKIR